MISSQVTKIFLYKCFYNNFKNVREISSLSLKNDAYVNGTWIQAPDKKVFAVTDPSTGKHLTTVPDFKSEDLNFVISSAQDAFEQWKNTTGKERSYLLRNWFDTINKHSDELARILSAESGKSLSEANSEVIYGNSFIDWFSGEARRIQGEIMDSPIKTREIFHIKQPIGVVALITPWNFPVAMITRKAGASLAAGCTIIVKPAEDTPLSALKLAEYAELAGIPKGVFNVITCDRKNAPSVGDKLCTDNRVAGISFTGSTVVGKYLYEKCSSTVKRLSLELGGNAPFIIFRNADLKAAVNGVMMSKFRNCGQTCVSANRILIEDKIFDEVIEMIEKSIKTQLTFDKDDKSGKNILGPLINKSQFLKVEGMVNDALNKGAKIHCGGKKSSIGDLYFEPTLLSNITPQMFCYNEEIFGPVASCIKFKDENEALKIANSTDRGLAGYFYSNDIHQIRRVCRQLEVGMVGVNEGLISACEAAFGGVKESGIGREGSHYGVEEFLNVKYLCLGNF